MINESGNQEVMDLKDLEITPTTHPLLIQMSHCYQDHTMIPARQDMLEAQYELPVTTGWLTMKGLVRQIGVSYEVALADAEERMARAMEDDND